MEKPTKEWYEARCRWYQTEIDKLSTKIKNLEEGTKNLQILLGHAYENNAEAYNQREKLQKIVDEYQSKGNKSNETTRL